ncbi:MAG: tRNA epoxyqueuosine(34) reductase QueG [Anaerolineae bacterium]|nr:tRNA epoxyqueuosine(34) reductase QueG [Anaerolineae bacterium]NUQ04915.1 tRNA epoxyqueuosine(34) reductase QueG [Anaerolineae bacterium]
MAHGPVHSAQVKRRARELGFNLVGIARAEPSPTLDAYERWIAAGMHGSMGYLARPDRLARRRDLGVILPDARSLVIVGLDYSAAIPQAHLNDPLRGRIASYAWGLDYHDVMGERLELLTAWLSESAGGAARLYVDTGAILERSHAQQAGLGFIGKNTMLIHPRRGSFFFLGEILTTLAFDAYDSPGRATLCGTCTRCLSACPTDAFRQPHVLDARRCISALTIEHKGWIAPDLRPLMGNWVYGCDVCQIVCPWNRFASAGDPAFAPPDQLERAAPFLRDLLALDDDQFVLRFAASPILRIRRDRLVRNACIAAGNAADPALLTSLLPRLEDHSPLVRGHAAWALGRFADERAVTALRDRLAGESDVQVLAEIADALT